MLETFTTRKKLNYHKFNKMMQEWDITYSFLNSLEQIIYLYVEREREKERIVFIIKKFNKLLIMIYCFIFSFNFFISK